MKPQQNNEGRGVPALTAEKRVILSMGGKGGVGKTSLITALTEWFDAKRIPAQLLDLDSENKARGSLVHSSAPEHPRSISTLRPAWTRSSINLSRARP